MRSSASCSTSSAQPERGSSRYRRRRGRTTRIEQKGHLHASHRTIDRLVHHRRQAVLPHLRQRQHGHIVQISTVGGVGTMPTFGLYNAAKWALEGFSEALAAEVADQGIRVTIAELGGFSTDWAGSSMQFAEPIAAYDTLRTSLFGSPTVPWEQGDGTDEAEATEPAPAVAAAALRAHVARDDGPLRLLVGDDAPGQVAAALSLRLTDYQRDARFAWPPPEPSGS